MKAIWKGIQITLLIMTAWLAFWFGLLWAIGIFDERRMPYV